MTEDFYRDLAADYDKVIRWERRLRNERPQFEALWKRFGTRSVLDASCGTGHHLAMFASMGLDVCGADASQAMVDHARRNAAPFLADTQSRITCCRWDELELRVPRQFDAVLCIGNSLPYVTNPASFRASLKGLWSRLSPGGILLIQFKNFGKLIADHQRFLPLSWSQPPDETIAIRMYEYHPSHVDFYVMLLTRQDSEWQLRHQVTALMPYRADDVAGPLRELGAQVSVFGSLALDSFDPQTSEDVLVLSARPDERSHESHSEA